MSEEQKPKKTAYERLRPQRRVFVDAYLRLWQGAPAAREANYKHPDRQAYRLLRNVEIQQAIKERLEELKMQADEVLIGLAQQARFDPLQFLKTYELNDGEIVRKYVGVNLDAIKEAGLGSVVRGIEYDKQGRMVVKFHDAQRARQLIGQHHKLFTQKHEVDVPQLEPLPKLLERLIDQVYGGSD